MSKTKYEIIVTHRLTGQKYKHIMNASLAKVNRIKKQYRFTFWTRVAVVPYTI